MPATAGRVRMPANNRVHSSAALQTHGIWQSAIGYDPYAPSEQEKKSAALLGREVENAYDSFQGLLALARLTSSNATETRGACKKCGRVGHLTFQCHNFLSLKDDLVLLPQPEKERKEKGKENEKMGTNGGEVESREKEGNLGGEEEEEEEDSTDVTDSSEDTEMERIIAERFGGKYGKGISRVKKYRVCSEDDCGENERRERMSKGGKVRVLSKKWDKSRVSSDEEVEDSEDCDRKRRGRSRKRKSRASSKNSEKLRVLSDDESESSEYDSEREERSQSRRRKSRVSKKYRVSRVSSYSEDSEHEDRERRKRSKSLRSSKGGYSHGFLSDSDEEKKWKRSKRRRVENFGYRENERRKRNGSCSTGSNSSSEEEEWELFYGEYSSSEEDMRSKPKGRK